nr:MAG TPA: hypothetical protein [Bacteriophage sp.]
MKPCFLILSPNALNTSSLSHLYSNVLPKGLETAEP